MDQQIAGFFAYPSQPPAVPEVIRAAIGQINKSQPCLLKDWQASRIGGKLIMNEICKSIDASDLFCADLTGFNPNVLFELGYAIARNKRIWLALDLSMKGTKQTFDQLRVLTTVGYAPYCNSGDIVSGFCTDAPWTDLDETIFATALEPSLTGGERGLLFYLKCRHETQAAIAVSTAVENAAVQTVVDDPRESGVQPLTWYGQKVYSAAGVLVHFSGLDREGAELHNARYALVAGLAYGFEKELLMLWEMPHEAPIDYRDLLRLYTTAGECKNFARIWLQGLVSRLGETSATETAYIRRVELATELRGLRLGEHIAENEEDRIADYFVETAAYADALEGRNTIIAGRKGAGKTATLYRIADELKRNKRNVVCVVKPVGYELNGMLRLLRKYKEVDAKGYLVQSLWKFLLYTEIARAVAQEVEARPSGVPQAPAEERLIGLLNADAGQLRQDFAVRLERSVESLFEISSGTSIGGLRTAVSERLHAGVLRELRAALGSVLEGRQRVAVLIDNLDKAWGKRSDVELLSEFLLGLLTVSRDIQRDFRKEDYWRKPVPLTLSVFLRSDIFDHVISAAREPDKMSYARITWDDPATLIRIVEERFVASMARVAAPGELWSRWFCPTARGLPTKTYLVQHVLPRPRDIVYLCNAAISVAVNRGHMRVEEADIIAAEKQYSQYALDALLVENGVSAPELEAVLYEFAGQQAVLEDQEVRGLVSSAMIAHERHALIVDHLCNIAFLGVEVRPDEFQFFSEPESARRHTILARRLAERHGGRRRYMVNTPFHAFLEIGE